MDVSNTTAVVGAPFADGPGLNQGKAYVLEREANGQWQEVALLESDQMVDFQHFGQSVAIDGDTIAVGQSTDTEGRVLLFERNAGGPDAWGQIDAIPDPDGNGLGRFGTRVYLQGTMLLAVAQAEETVYLFERDPTSGNWNLSKSLTHNLTTGNTNFGLSVACTSDLILVTASSQTSVGAGEILVFERDLGGPSNWGQATVLLASDALTSDDFGGYLAFDGQTLLAGTPEFGPGDGAVYVFDRDPLSGTWSELGKLDRPPILGPFEYMGPVAMSGDIALVSAPGANGPGSAPLRHGKVFTYFRTGSGPTGWEYQGTLLPNNPQGSEFFGVDVALDGTRAVVGRPFYIANGPASGAVELYAVRNAPIGSAVATRNAGGNPNSLSVGPLGLGGSLDLTCDVGSTSHWLGLFLAFDTPVEIVLSGGQTLLSFDLGGSGELLTGAGQLATGPLATSSFPIPNDTQFCGFPFSVQAVHFGGTVPFALSNAQDITLGL